MLKAVAFAVLSSLAFGCVMDNKCSDTYEPIVSPANISSEVGSGEVQIPHYVPTWYE